MRCRALFSVVLACLAGLASAATGWWRVHIHVPDQAALQRLLDSDVNVMPCTPGLGHVDAILGPGEEFKLALLGLDYHRLGPVPPPDAWKGRENVGLTSSDYRTAYFTADQILAFFEDYRSRFPALINRFAIGTSINGETIWGYRIRRPAANSGREKGFLMIGLTHSREWVSGSVVMHILAKTIEGLTTPQTRPFLNNQGMYIVPILNPDGYRFTWTNDRFWRKNRRNNGNGTFGVDLNRNYSVGWGGAGSSGNGSSQTYRGTAPFSEPETQAVRSFNMLMPGMVACVDWHSFGQLVLWPWSHITTPPPTAAELDRIGRLMVTGLAVRGQTYRQGPAWELNSFAAGSSKDYFYDANGNAPSCTLELRDTGAFGFALPENQISPTQDEAWEAVRVLLGQFPG